MKASAIWLHHEQRLIEKHFRCYNTTGKVNPDLIRKIENCRIAMHNALDYEITK